MKTLLQGGSVIDGTGAAPFPADVLMEGGAIVRVEKDLSARADRILSCAGRVVAPGFIDIHRHCDLAALRDADFGLLELAQGITGVVGGNCGLSPVPMGEARAAQAEAFLAPCLGPAKGLRFPSLEAYLAALEKAGLPLHMGMLAAIGAIRIRVKGFAKAPFTVGEMDRARALLRESLEAGALGLSVGIMYPPECYTSREEYVRLLSAAAPFGRPLCCHIRGEGDSLVASVAEVIEIGERAGVPVHISHFKSTGRKNWNREIYRAIEVIEDARARGQDVTVDFYPYTAGATTLVSLLPPGVLEDDNERLWDKLGTAVGVEEVRAALASPPAGWDDMVGSIGWENIQISAARMPGGAGIAGKRMPEAARLLGLAGPLEALCHILSQTRGQAGIVVHSMTAEDVAVVARLPYAMIISDALYGEGGTHPRLYGAFPRALRHLVREEGLLTWQEAIHKMTGLPARRLGLSDRGRVAPGYVADVCVFSPQDVTDVADYLEPRRLSRGMDAVFIRGREAFVAGGEAVLVRAGGVLRGG